MNTKLTKLLACAKSLLNFGIRRNYSGLKNLESNGSSMVIKIPNFSTCPQCNDIAATESLDSNCQMTLGLKMKTKLLTVLANFTQTSSLPPLIGSFDSVLSCVEPLISQQDNSSLMQEVTPEEIKLVVFELGSNKAPGPDGFTGAFYQNAWPTVGNQVCSLIKEFFHTGFPLDEINSTDMVLIPKKDCPESVSDYRPISLCNFSYKIFSKVLANRLKPLMGKIITKNQRAFVPGRLIQDNLIIVHEIFHHMKNKR